MSDFTFFNNVFLKLFLQCVKKSIHGGKHQPFPKPQILDSSKVKASADDNIKFNENGRKFAEWVENTMGKGDVARYQQCLLFPRVFKRLVL